MELQDVRDNLDRIDYLILKLLNTRMELALRSKKFKESIEDNKREAFVLENIRKQSRGLINPDFCEKLFIDIIAESKKLQSRDYKLIGFQGEHGAYSELAAMEWNKKIIPIPCKEFKEVFEEVKSGLYDFGIVPVENMLGGVISQVNEALMEFDLFVVGAVKLPIHYSLLALPGTDYREIHTVYSHSSALEQSHDFLARNNLHSIPFYDTAGAARMLAEKRPKASAVIASDLAAALYNLEIIKENIENVASNMTRYFIISKDESKDDGSKCSINFSTEHKAGALFEVFELFAKEKINLTRIESIPNRMGSYAFFLDFLGSKNDEKIKRVLEQLSTNTKNFKLMGCYREIELS